MLEIMVKGSEYYDESTNEFIMTDDCALQLEHSLFSLSKWEAKWHKPFLSEKPKSPEEALDYIRCMTLNAVVDPTVYDRLPITQINVINEYIEDKQTATWFTEQNSTPNREVITAEIIYYWMVSLQIPTEFEKWHFTRLLTLIKVCNIKNGSGKKMSSREVLSQNHAINAKRLAEMRNGT